MKMLEQQKLVQNAIDAIIDLEGDVYPNGLPSECVKALSILRKKDAHLQDTLNVVSEND